MADVFFTSHFDYSVLLSWIDNVRNTLLAFNEFTPNNPSGLLDPAILSQILENKAISLSLQGQQVGEQSQQNANVVAGKTLTSNIAKGFVDDSLRNMDLVDEHIDAVQTKTLNSSDSLTDRENASLTYGHLGADGNNQFGQTGNSDRSVAQNALIFPQQNKPYNANLEAISSRLVELYEFPVQTTSGTPNPKKNEVFFKSWAKIGRDGKISPDDSLTFTANKAYSPTINNIFKKYQNDYPGSFKFFIEKLHGRYSNGTAYRKNPIKSTKGQKQIPIELTNRMVFCAYINNFNDGYNVDFAKYNFLGRGEPLASYKQTTRNFVIEFTMLADYSAQLIAAMSETYRQLNAVASDELDKQFDAVLKTFPDWGLGQYGMPQVNGQSRFGGHIPGMYSDSPESLWYKISFLAQCCYPYYRDDGKMKEQPFIRIRVGDFYDVVATITSFNLDLNVFDDGVMMDVNPSSLGNIPLGIKVTMNCEIYHDYEPSSTFLGFYNRKEFDTDPDKYDPVTGKGLKDAKLDLILSNLKKNSPATVGSNLQKEGLQDSPRFLEENYSVLVNSLAQFKNNFSSLKSVGLNIAEQSLKSKTQAALLAYSQISQVASIFKAFRFGGDTSSVDTLNADNAFSFSNPVSGVSNFGSAVSSTVKGNYVGDASSAGGIINDAGTNIKNNFSDGLQSSLTQSNNTVNAVKQDSQELPNLKSDLGTLQSASSPNLKTPSQYTPKTLGDILDKLNQKNS